MTSAIADDVAEIYAAKPWLARYPQGTPDTIDVAELGSLPQLLLDAAVESGDLRAFSSGVEHLTYRELAREALAFTRWLQDQGYVKGDRIALMLPNVLAFPVALFGVLAGGYVATCANPLYTAPELTNQLRDSGARLLVVLDEFGPVVAEAAASVALDSIVVASAGIAGRDIMLHADSWKSFGAHGFADVLALGRDRALDNVIVAVSDIALLQYTGGTTGISKAAVLTHGNLNGNAEMMRAWLEPTLRRRAPSGQLNMIAALPLYHIYALNCCCVLSMRMGAHSILIRDPRDLAGFINVLASTEFHITWGVNTLYSAILNHPAAAGIDFSRLALAVGGGAAMLAPTADAWKRRTGVHVLEGYGMSETSPCVTLNRPDEADFNGAVGYPLPSVEVSLRGEDGRVVPFDAAGEVCIRAPTVMREYWRRPEETANAFTEDGFFKSGDIGVMSPDGMLRIVDRRKDVIFVSGFNVFPNEVENVIAAHPEVIEVAVVGVPDARSGERVVAFVVPRNNGLDADALRAFARKSLTAYKVPKEIVLCGDLPKTAVGKVLRRVLRETARKGAVE